MGNETTSLKMKLAVIQKKLKAPKGQFNAFAKYKYRSCEDILEALKPLLEQCLLTLSDEIIEISGRFYVKSTATITDGTAELRATGLAREEENKKGMDGSQITGAASSYARKYALNGMFLIDDSKDSDHTNNGKNGSSEKITEKQFSVLLDLINEYGANEAKFLEYMKIDKLSSMPVDKYKQAVTALEQKGKAKK